MDSIRILVKVLEDAEADREFIIDMLSENELLDIEGFYDQAEFKGSINKDIDLVITDIRVPNYDVFETIEYLYNDFPGIYIIVMSAYIDIETHERLRQLRVDETIEKDDIRWIIRLQEAVNRLIPRIIKKRELLK